MRSQEREVRGQKAHLQVGASGFRPVPICLGLLVLALPLSAQLAKDANAGSQTPEAQNLKAPDHDERQTPKELVQAMGLLPGMTVADVGTGIGYMLPFLSRAVGPYGKVIAEDIFDDYLAAARVLATGQQLTNVEFIKGTEKDPGLPEGAVDAVLALEAYHHFDYPQAILAGIHRALKPGGELVVVESYKTTGATPGNNVLAHTRPSKADVIKELEANHFRMVSER